MPSIPALFARLDDAKFARAFWHSLTAAQAFGCVYKAFGISCGTLGFCVLCSLSVSVEKEDFLEEMRQRSSKVARYGIMTFGLDAHFAWDAPPLELHVLDVPGAPCLPVFTQVNVAASRKQVALALVTFFFFEKTGRCWRRASQQT